MSVPKVLIERNKLVEIVADVMFICGLPFMISMSCQIHFVTAQYIPCKTASELCNSIKDVIRLYKQAIFTITTDYMDDEFKPLKEKLLNWITIDTTAKNKHVGEIKRKISHVMERSRCIKSMLPYKKMSNVMIKALVSHVVMWLNAVVNNQGIL